MKLNLLPKAVERESSLKRSIIISVVIALAGIAAAVGMVVTSNEAAATATREADEARPAAEAAVREAKRADAIVAPVRGVLVNTMLAEAIQDHSTKYPDFYDEVRKYIPSFMRVTSMSATPSGQQTSVTITGVLETYQQYADVMIALLRMPGVQTVGRAGFVNNLPTIQPLSATNQATGLAVTPGITPLPTDPRERLDYLLANGYPTTPAAERNALVYTGVGGFGSGEPGLRGAMPGWSQVTLTMVVARDLQAPAIRTTLISAGSPAAGGGGQPQPMQQTPPPIPGGGGPGDDDDDR